MRIDRFECDNKGQTSLVVFAAGYEECKRSLIRYGARILYQFPFLRAFGVTAWVHKAEAIGSLDNVRAVRAESKVTAYMDRVRECVLVNQREQDEFVPQLALSKNGEIGIAVMDTGFAPHLDIMCPKMRLRAFKDFVGNGEQAYDDNGHGSFVAAAACGNGLVSCGRLCGIAPSAQLVALKCLDEKGASGAFKILEAMQWIYSNHKKYNIRVVCMSFGSEALENNDPLALGAEVLWREGLVVVAAAGNSGPRESSITSPGICPHIITVGGADFEGNVASFSSRGPMTGGYIKPDLVAPSVDIMAAGNGSYTKMSGTSVATPIVAGICARMLEQNPSWNNNKIKQELLATAKPLTAKKDWCGSGMAQL